ncbi:hypothetical protein [Massilia sp. LjRoot122]|uniref:hypothetical protein n=1 Tax=Massilia sp. LjRoot122 TaxID=3342257 RepID=UPI003ECCA0EF
MNKSKAGQQKGKKNFKKIGNKPNIPAFIFRLAVLSVFELSFTAKLMSDQW